MGDSTQPMLDLLKVIEEPDVDPDLSFLGEWSDEPGPADRTIDRKARGVMGRGEKRYFIAALGPDETGAPESVEADWKRMESYGRTWSMVGIRAKAIVRVAGSRQTLYSPGIWGVESDASPDHHKELAREEVAHLRRILDTLGVESPGTFPDERAVEVE